MKQSCKRATEEVQYKLISATKELAIEPMHIKRKLN